jgi:hypothetical protein
VDAHPCGEAHQALARAGHEPEVVRSYGFRSLPGLVNDLAPRRKVKEEPGGSAPPAPGQLLDEIRGPRRPGMGVGPGAQLGGPRAQAVLA